MATKSMPDEVVSLIDQFPDEVELDEDAVADRYRMLVDEYRVPSAEALQVTRNYWLDELDLAFGDLEGQRGGPSSGPADERSLASVSTSGEWLSVTAKVVDLWENDVDSIAQVGLIGDESGTIKCTIWASANAPTIEADEVYRFENVVTDEYQGRLSVQVNSSSEIVAVEDEDAAEIKVGSTDAFASGVLVAVQPGSGLIKRCPEEDCTRVLQNGRCSEHGAGEGEFDLRVKAVLDDGQDAVDVIFDAEATAALTGLSIEESKELAMDALDTSVVGDAIREQVLGRAFAVTGPVYGEYLLVNECEALGAPSLETIDQIAAGEQDALSAAAASSMGAGDLVAPGNAANGDREVAQRVFAQEFNEATHTFTESDEERAPRYVLLPSGAKANRVVVVGTLTETQDVGRESEYWQGRVVGPTGTFFVYAGQYQPEAASVLREIEPPEYVAVVGKPRTYETDDGDVNVSIRPESITVVDGGVRDRWVAETAARTRERLEAIDVDEGEDGYAAMAVEEYEPDLDTFQSMVEDVLDDLAAD